MFFLKRIKIFLIIYAVFKVRIFWLYQPDEDKTLFYPQLTGKDICEMRGSKPHDFSLIYFFLDLAATCSPTPSPVQYHRPLRS